MDIIAECKQSVYIPGTQKRSYAIVQGVHHLQWFWLSHKEFYTQQGKFAVQVAACGPGLLLDCMHE